MGGKRFDSLVFPGGKSRALTLSYDDGVVQDRRLIPLLDSYGLKATFNLGAGVLGFHGFAPMKGRQVDISKVEPEEVRELYRDHEVAGHTLWHSSLTAAGTPATVYEIIEDKHQLEELTGKLVRSFAYPFGTWDAQAVELLRLCGYESARTVVSTGEFGLPGDFLTWDATCHHNDPKLMELAERFLADDRFPRTKLFYLWGHAYEFDADDNWDVMERFAERMAKDADKFWAATNGQIRDYVNAFRSLRYGADGELVYNPSALEIWMMSSRQLIRVAPGETVQLPHRSL